MTNAITVTQMILLSLKSDKNFSTDVGNYLSSDEEDIPHCSLPEPESTINDQGGLSHCSSPEPGPSFTLHKSAKYTAIDSKNVVPNSGMICFTKKSNSRRKSNFGVHANDEVNKSDGQRRVLININHRLNEVDVFSAPQLSRVAKAHPFGGIRFLYDNIVQSLGKFSTSKGAGCFLAHSMGLGEPFRSVPLLMCFYNISQLGGS
ncbi:hypothetical protein DAPPUDRAFT_102666 [Daphnia pulex]|uniref:Uncharacterized protein n=1 Tax=Daphnia pulex TaxID=6669 RepID=E9GH39_DAPPU|nr:hypothetical protein DAPPUDRAFT_102666 [Daphnia pulex]|eukprot:EFX81135.1 hypothetical protein DAPPUDRAFT_102666 [Daphnia pulex]